jgi:hypothetical protein
VNRGIGGVTVDVSNTLKPDLVESNLRFGMPHARNEEDDLAAEAGTLRYCVIESKAKVSIVVL